MDNAKLRFSYGTMSSGKSLQVLTTAHNFETKNIHFLIFKSDIDTRDGATTIKSRIGNGIERECIPVHLDTNLFEYVKNYIEKTNNCPKLSWVIVDEAQFLTEEQVDQLSDVVDYLNIDVYCFGLRTDFKTHLFSGSKRLFEIADKIDEIKSTCECGRKNLVNAKFTKDGKLARAGGQIQVGGDESYSAICRRCYKEKMKEQEND